MPHYEKLDAWSHCHELTLAVYRATDDWPGKEQYGLISQVRRAAVSTAANIAEGSAKRSDPDFKRFLAISLGSLAEVEYLLRLARDLGYLTIEAHRVLHAIQQQAGRTTWGLYRSIRNRRK